MRTRSTLLSTVSPASSSDKYVTGVRGMAGRSFQILSTRFSFSHTNSMDFAPSFFANNSPDVAERSVASTPTRLFSGRDDVIQSLIFGQSLVPIFMSVQKDGSWLDACKK